MHPRRRARLNELIQQTVSRCILNLKDPGIGFVTITDSEISPDVSLVKIFYSVLGDAKTRADTAAGLERAKSYVRREVGQLENLRRVPEIMFVYDQSVVKADRVNQLLHTIENERDEDNSHSTNG
ncbi:MAG: 30S ribosome-binding factor RbfA [Elusimicrobiota bacterium]